MQVVDISAYSQETIQDRPKLILLKGVTVLSLAILLSGVIIDLVQRQHSSFNVGKADEKEKIMPGDGRRNLNQPNQPTEPQIVITKKPQQPIIVEEGSDAWFCLKNNGGSGCLGRDKIAPNYKVVEQKKSYNDYLMDYGIQPNNCPPEISWQPNCQNY